jgi:uroporphyrinogen-III decarboxylase
VDPMTHRERLLAALAGEDVDRLPWSPFLAYVWGSFRKEIRDAGMDAFYDLIGADPLHRGGCCPVREVYPTDVTIKVVDNNHSYTRVYTTPVGTLTERYEKSTIGDTAFIVGHPLKTEEDYKIFAWIEEHKTYEYQPDVVKHYLKHAGDSVTMAMLVPRTKTAFQKLVEDHVGTEELIYALADFPDTVEMLWNLMVENNRTAATLSVQAPFEHWITWEDSSTANYSPAMYDQYIGSEITEWCTLLKDNGNKKYHQHACGSLKAILPSMVNQGVAGVESLSPPPTGNISLADARKVLGPDVCITGGIEPTEFLNLSLEELEPYVEQVIEDGKSGAFVLANSDSCPPGVTVEKFKLVGDIVRRVKP